jgi:glycosyltransferase involved in cell wall biosynthesis
VKIAFICNEYPPARHGGIGTTVRLLANELSHRGHRVLISGIYKNLNHAKISHEMDENVTVERIPVPRHRFGWLLARYQLYCRIRDGVERGEVDLVEVPDYEGMAAAWPRLPVPFVTRFHGSGTYNQWEQNLPVIQRYFWLENSSIKRNDYHVAPSMYTARRSEEIYKLPVGSVHLIYNPIEVDFQFATSCKSKNRVIFTGTLVRRKGIISLIRAWPEVLVKFPFAELHIYGKDTVTSDGTLMSDYLYGILPHDARRSIRFHGHVSREELSNALSSARVAIFPSYSETFGNGPVEAMAVGCPTIYTKRSCGPEIIEDGVDGLLVDPEEIENISASIVRILQDDFLTSRLGSAAREKVKAKFSLGRIIPQNEEFYAHCIEQFWQGDQRSSYIS